MKLICFVVIQLGIILLLFHWDILVCNISYFIISVYCNEDLNEAYACAYNCPTELQSK